MAANDRLIGMRTAADFSTIDIGGDAMSRFG
jgi:hypothetical protein